VSLAVLAAGGAVFRRTWSKTVRRPVVLTFSLLQPLMWILFFGFLFQNYRIAHATTEMAYREFLLPGVCGMTVLFGASQAGVELIRDMQTGFLARILSTPADHRVILAGKVAADVTRLLVQALLVCLVGLGLGIRVSPSYGGLLLAAAALTLLAAGVSCISCAVALLTRAPEGMGVFIHLVNMPMLFTSTALAPRREMPAALATLARFNPLSLGVDALRGALMFGHMPSFTQCILPLAAFAILLFALTAMILARWSRNQ
jgi:ABC-2 type transport system permease protein